MKIIKPPVHKLYRGKCDNCECEVECDETEITPNRIVACPHCASPIAVTLVSRDPKPNALDQVIQP